MQTALRLAITITLANCCFGYCKADVTDSPRLSSVTRVLAGGREACLINPPTKPTETGLTILAPLLASLGSKAAEIGYDALSNYISETIKAQESSLTVAVKSAYFYRLKKGAEGKWGAEPALDCIVIARGRPGPIDVLGLRLFAQRMDPRSRFSKVDEKGERSFPILQTLGFSDFPDLYLEFAFERDPLDTVFRLQPRVIYYKQPSVKAAADGKLDLNLTVTISQPGLSTPSAVLPFRLAGVQAGADVPIDGVSIDNPWAPMLPPPDEKFANNERAKLFSSLPSTPSNVSITLEETGSASRYLVFLSRFLNASKSDINNSATELLNQLADKLVAKEAK
ncbi:hypothetical protein [Bradyrhizobium australiense]|uniref:Uncharacterized protein n=1 Tax=Bradyrhizobium australiense TaxID=2721161 RepID=A0A7Y4GNI6_9BRAD|nr:hypothetical protein [Bradyrhizobium australiense]NOJ39055.1 hypothetical protein [Bradyrhizobium australiense]